MKKVMSAIAAGLLVFGSQGVMADLDTSCPGGDCLTNGWRTSDTVTRAENTFPMYQ